MTLRTKPMPEMPIFINKTSQFESSKVESSKDFFQRVLIRPAIILEISTTDEKRRF